MRFVAAPCLMSYGWCCSSPKSGGSRSLRSQLYCRRTSHTRKRSGGNRSLRASTTRHSPNHSAAASGSGLRPRCSLFSARMARRPVPHHRWSSHDRRAAVGAGMTACRLVARPVRAGLRDFAEQAAIRQIWLQNEHSSQIRSYSRRAISRNIFFRFPSVPTPLFFS